MAEARRCRRASVRWDVAFEEPGRQLFVPALNVSASGIFLASPDVRPQVGSPVRVVVSLPPDGVFLRLSGSVVRHAASGEPDGFAIRFDDADPRSFLALQRFVAHISEA
jgi:hypothetical protein